MQPWAGALPHKLSPPTYANFPSSRGEALESGFHKTHDASMCTLDKPVDKNTPPPAPLPNTVSGGVGKKSSGAHTRWLKHSRGSPKTWGTKSQLVGATSGRECYITPAFSGILKDMGTKSELVGPTSGRKCYITPEFSGIPKERGTKSELDA